MNRISFAAIAAFAMLSSGTALAQGQCDRPVNANIPDGASASLDQMLEAQTSVRDYLTSMEEYLECMNEIIDGADEDAEAETVNSWIDEYNTGVDEMEQTATRFNEERVAYQQANPSE